jgi:hypothetical protein
VVLERLVDVLDIIGDALCLAQKLLRPLDGLLELLERRKRQARKVARLIDQTRRLVLKRRDLVVDLLERPRGGQEILCVVGGVVDDPAKLCVAGRRHERDRGDGDRQERGGHTQRARAGTSGTVMSVPPDRFGG